MNTPQMKRIGMTTYLTTKTPLKVGDFAYCNETREIIQISKIITEDHLYEDIEGNMHYDNFDPWNWLKIIKTTDKSICDISSEVKPISILELV